MKKKEKTGCYACVSEMSVNVKKDNNITIFKHSVGAVFEGSLSEFKSETKNKLVEMLQKRVRENPQEFGVTPDAKVSYKVVFKVLECNTIV